MPFLVVEGFVSSYTAHGRSRRKVDLVGGAIVFSRAARPAEDSEYTYSGGIPVCPVKSLAPNIFRSALCPNLDFKQRSRSMLVFQYKYTTW